ncbi:C-C chemokine receptor type 3-like [Clarias gariepinus]|uniref:C-C chemokine receptor type 3-like n=1 Tax=Clarias gariepinus TaxID=13013 RepID=UPI00234D12B3|nr:C-C chemokine receptor type 3-like [Clarias gariepinus]
MANQGNNLTNYTPCSNTKEKDFSRIFLPTFYSIVILVGFLGNSLVVCVMVKYHKKFKTSDLCLFNLAVSDLIFLISLLFWAHYSTINEWIFGSFMCHAVTLLYMMGFYGSIFFMILMTIERYTSIVHASKFLSIKQRSVRTGIALVLFMWALSLGASVPTIIFLQFKNNSNVSQCRVDYPEGKEWKVISYIELNILGLIIPLSLMVFCYSRIIPIVMSTESQGKYKSVKLMVVLIIVFFIFWTPYNIVIFMTCLHHLDYMQSCQWNLDLQMAMQWVETIAFSHCSLNPIIYALVGQKFKYLFLRILKEFVCFKRWTTVESHSLERMTIRNTRPTVI